MYVLNEGLKKGVFQNNILIHVEEDERNDNNVTNNMNMNDTFNR